MTAAMMELSGIGQGVLCTMLLLVLCEGLCALLLWGICRTPVKYAAMSMVPCAVMFVTLCAMMEGIGGEFRTPASAAEKLVWHMPAWGMVLLLAAASAWTGRVLLLEHRWRQEHISGTTVKESLDHLPSGLCFYLTGGLPQLVNVQMEKLCRELTGGPLRNGTDFWRRLTQGDVLPGNAVLQKGDAPMVRTADGRVWSFTCCETGRDMVQIAASDITQEQEMNARLALENRRLEDMNRRLRQYGSRIRELTRERETLSAKARIHDEFGQALLAARRLVKQPADARQCGEVLRMWRKNLTLMGSMDGQAPAPRGFDGLIAAAKAVGMRVTVEGGLPPEDAPCMELMENAVHECLTNAVRHAGGTELRVKISQADGRIRASMSNDGEPPESAVTEGGGLSSLRRRVERAGGTMTVQSTPRFVLTVELPMESEEWT